jgi:1,4-alpha-glucan branching enzyme
VLLFKRGDLLFVFNFHPENSYDNYRFPAAPGKYNTLLNSDAECFNGFARVDATIPHFTLFENACHYLQLYIPSRSAMVLKIER